MWNVNQSCYQSLFEAVQGFISTMWNVNETDLIEVEGASNSFISTMWNVNRLPVDNVLFGFDMFYLNYVECKY